MLYTFVIQLNRFYQTIKKMKNHIVLFADGWVGKKILKFLIQKYFSDLILIVTIRKNEIYNLAKKYDLKVKCYNDFEDFFNTLSFDYGVLAWWPQIINESIISKAKKGFINTHPSLLPNNRGKHYNFWAIVEELPFGVSIHMVEKNIDSGPIISQKKIDYTWVDDGESLYKKAQNEMIKLFKKFYSDFREGNFKLRNQDLSKGSFHNSSELINASKIELDKKYFGREILNILRAKTFKGYQGSWFEDNGEKYEIKIKIKKI